jgi:hypothetical protein
MSFSCPHFDYDRDGCWRLGKPCVPGRPGCVLRSNSVFKIPAKERLEQEAGRRRPAPEPPEEAGDHPQPFGR